MDTLMYAMLFVPLGFPVVPWLFCPRFGRREIWLSTAVMVTILLCLPLIFWEACGLYNCGQGAVALLMLVPIWMFMGLATVASAALADYYLRRRDKQRSEAKR
jgi:hypothetical protein